MSFAEWAYHESSLEGAIGKEDYLKLIEYDYRKTDEADGARTLVVSLYDKYADRPLVRDRVVELLEKMIRGEYSLKKGCEELSKYNMDGHDFIPMVFVGYASELVDDEKRDFYDERIKKDSMELLSVLKDLE